MRHALSAMRHALSAMPHAPCATVRRTPNAECRMPFPLVRPKPPTSNSMRYALCPMPYALCPAPINRWQRTDDRRRIIENRSQI